jgi:hypothetical protein
MDGRKNKRAPTRMISRHIPVGESRPDRHPISLLILYRDAVFRFARSRWMVRPRRVWELPNGTIREFESGLMNTWWSKAVAEANVSVEGHITSHSHRSGSSTSAFKLGVPVPDICQIADWDTHGKAFYDTYYRSSLKCLPHLQRRYFEDLLTSSEVSQS